MAVKKVPILKLVRYLRWGLDVKCGYIMGSYGQDPKKWSIRSWWFTQYSGRQRTKALYWRAHAPAVHDCNGIAEGCYLEKTGININSRARNNYATWCSPKGRGKIPNQYKVPGAAVFKDNGSYVHHVGYLLEPIDASNPKGDWWVCEAKGVMYGWVRTRLSATSWNKWGLMTRYFDYAEVLGDAPAAADPVEFGHRMLRIGTDGSDVKALQLAMIALGYSCGRAGADGEFGPKTRSAVKAFQEDHDLSVDGIAGPNTFAAFNACLPEDGEDSAPDAADKPATVKVTGGSVYVRTQPGTYGAKLGVVHKGDMLTASGETADGWRGIVYNGEKVWITKKYTEVAA